MTLRVIARGDARVPYVGDGGRAEPGRWAGRSFSGDAAPEAVPDLAYYRRAISRGDLDEAPDVASEVATPPTTESLGARKRRSTTEP